MPTCLNLKERFGANYRIHREEGATIGDPWGLLIPCRYGHIYPWGGDRLAASIDGHKGIPPDEHRPALCRGLAGWRLRRGNRSVRRFPFCRGCQDYASQARRTHLSPERKAAAIERLARINAERRQNDQETAPDCVPRPQGDSEVIPSKSPPFHLHLRKPHNNERRRADLRSGTRPRRSHDGWYGNKWG